MTSTRPSLKRTIAIGVGAAIAASAASPSLALTGRSTIATETGRQSDLVNRPGCWTESGYDGRFPCEVASSDPDR